MLTTSTIGTAAGITWGGVVDWGTGAIIGSGRGIAAAGGAGRSSCRGGIGAGGAAGGIACWAGGGAGGGAAGA
ncbi:MAG TPA: hypothetical protein VGK00_06485 [Anaerolineales bacterium]